MSYPVYAVMRDSGVEWLGDLPEHWNQRKLKFLARFSGGGTPSTTNDDYWSGDIPWVSPKDMKVSLISDSEDHISEKAIANSATNRIEPGTVLIVVRSGILKHSIPVAINTVSVALNQDMKAIKPSSELSPHYVLYVVAGCQDRLLLEWRKIGATVESLEFEYIANTQWPLPSLSEQQRIAAFLDVKTSDIDELIGLKEQQVRLLQQQRMALISRAVTKGLDPHAPMRDSGVVWLGEVPEAWQLTRVKFVVHSIQTGPFGSQLHAIDYVDNGIPVINPSNLQAGKIIPDQRVSIDQDTFNRLSRHVLLKDDIVCARRGELGRCGLVTEHEQGWLCGTGSLRVRPDTRVSLPEYLTAQLSMQRVKEWLSLSSVGSTMDNLNTEILANVPIVLPSLKQQQEIIDYLDRETAHIDSLVATIEKQIEMLRTYRQALITAAVTGKIDVRGTHIPAEVEE